MTARSRLNDWLEESSWVDSQDAMRWSPDLPEDATPACGGSRSDHLLELHERAAQLRSRFTEVLDGDSALTRHLIEDVDALDAQITSAQARRPIRGQSATMVIFDEWVPVDADIHGQYSLRPDPAVDVAIEWHAHALVHLDGNPRNCHPDNLRIIDPRENRRAVIGRIADALVTAEDSWFDCGGEGTT